MRSKLNGTTNASEPYEFHTDICASHVGLLVFALSPSNEAVHSKQISQSNMRQDSHIRILGQSCDACGAGVAGQSLGARRVGSNI